jgi:multidrug efflux pump subunit AcrB
MFSPLLGYYLLRPPKRPEPSMEERRTRGFYGAYYRLAGRAIRWRWAVIGISLLFLGLGVIVASKMKSQFFPEDVQYWSYVDVWLPNDAALSATNDAASRVESIVRRVSGAYARAHPSKESDELLESLTTFVGGGGPRFWYSAAPELPQRNYAQIMIRLHDKEATQTHRTASIRCEPGSPGCVRDLTSTADESGGVPGGTADLRNVGCRSERRTG